MLTVTVLLRYKWNRFEPYGLELSPADAALPASNELQLRVRKGYSASDVQAALDVVSDAIAERTSRKASKILDQVFLWPDSTEVWSLLWRYCRAEVVA